MLTLPTTHHDLTTEYPRELESYDLRDCIAHGCCGAVYEARVRGDEGTAEGVVKSGAFLHKVTILHFVAHSNANKEGRISVGYQNALQLRHHVLKVLLY